MNTNKKLAPIAGLGVQVGNTVRGLEDPGDSRVREELWFEGIVTRVNNGIATVKVTTSENGIFDGEELFEFTHTLTVVAR